MKKITEVTRDNLFYIIEHGLFTRKLLEVNDNCEWQEDKKYYWVYMPFNGKKTELEFLGRVYPLGSIPSNDRRYKNVYQEICQHTIYNNDWSEFWFLYDDRFKLAQGNDDECLLKFICEMLHPVVRVDDSRWKEYLKKFNELLQVDGYKIVVKEQMSGYEVYQAVPMDTIQLPVSSEITKNLHALGSGSYANVSKYHDDFYDTDFVVKKAKNELNDKEIARFIQEFNEMKQLSSPYVVEVYAYNYDKNQYIMECMDCTLGEFIRNNPSLNISGRKQIALQIFKAIKYIHSKNLFHRDIFHTNVLIKKYDDVVIAKLSDFGLVKVPSSTLTSDNTELKGRYNDPSLETDGFANYNLKHEIYALTKLMTFLLTGKENFSKIKDQRVKMFLNKGTDPNKDNRYASIDDMRKAFCSLCAEMDK